MEDTMVMPTAQDGHPKWATDGRQDSNIVYSAGMTYIAYESSDGLGYQEDFPGPSGTGGYIKIIAYDHEHKQWLGPFTVSDKPVFDDHGYPDLAVDSRGYLHIVYDGHQIPLKYKRSLRPNDASAWTASEDVGDRATYPHLLVGNGDTLFLFYRERGDSYDRWVEDMRTKVNDGPWSAPKTILDAEWIRNDPANDYCLYAQSVHLGLDNSIYLTWSWENHGDAGGMYDVGFAKSSDFGNGWTWADGTPYALPIKRSGQYEKLWDGPYPSYLTSVAANQQGQVIVLLYEFQDGWTDTKIHQSVWNAGWKSSIIATGALHAQITIDYAGVAHGLVMTESPYHIMYMEAKSPYTSWTFKNLDSPVQSFYPTVKNYADGGLFEGTWHARVSADHSDLYYFELPVG
jgi:hypothetical protein